jgi:HK97 family phage prohead protease
MRIVSPRHFKLLNGEPRGGRLVRRLVPADAFGVRKLTVETVEPEGERTLRFVISTGIVDRDFDSINQAGWHLDDYKKNPVVLWAHDSYSLPIGKAVDLVADGARLSSAVKFLPSGYGEASDFADTVYRLSRDGWLSATSVGFRPLAWDFSEDEARGGDGWWPGIDFHEQELMEFSLCCVPANPEALIEPGALVEAGDSPAIEPPAAGVTNAAIRPGWNAMRARRQRAALAAGMLR